MSDMISEIKKIIKEHHEDIDIDNINFDEDLIDQGFDSLVRTDLFITLGEAFDVELMEVDEDEVGSLSKVIAFIEKEKNNNPDDLKKEKSTLGHKDLMDSLRKIGLCSGDTILVHSGLFNLGALEHKSAEENLELIYQSIMEVIGKEGTLVVPAFFYEYGRWDEVFDIVETPVSKELGAFSKFISDKAEAIRSLHPLTALAAIGKNADFITNGNCKTSYGVGSAWDRFYESNGKMLFLGVNLSSMTFVHYVEHRVGVPHVYNKFHTTPVLKNGENITSEIISSVRFLDYDIVYAKESYTEMFRSAGILKEEKIGSSISYLVDAKEAFSFLVEELNKNIFCLLRNKPEFRSNEIPMSGKAGPARE